MNNQTQKFTDDLTYSHIVCEILHRAELTTKHLLNFYAQGFKVSLDTG